MGFYGPDVYSQPEHFGLKILSTVDWDDDSWQFDMTVIFQGPDGTLYWADDSGCSCSSPFEGFKTLESLMTGTFYELVHHLNKLLDEKLKHTRPSDKEKLQITDQVVKAIGNVRFGKE